MGHEWRGGGGVSQCVDIPHCICEVLDMIRDIGNQCFELAALRRSGVANIWGQNKGEGWIRGLATAFFLASSPLSVTISSSSARRSA